MRKLLSLGISIWLFIAGINDFKDDQLQYPRVRIAYDDKEEYIVNLLEEKGIDDFNIEIFIRAFKHEEEFEIWVKTKDDTPFQLLKTYDICSSSGELGPKRKEGDFQVPEGVYHINHFNPYSNFFLSLGINYPNSSDKILGSQSHPGGNIYIHGSCVTIGCIPLTDEKIKEVYVLAVEAKNAGQGKIPVHIFPFRMTEDNMEVFKEEYESESATLEFWDNIKPIYDYFETHKKNPSIRINNEGIYYF